MEKLFALGHKSKVLSTSWVTWLLSLPYLAAEQVTAPNVGGISLTCAGLDSIMVLGKMVALRTMLLLMLELQFLYQKVCLLKRV